MDNQKFIEKKEKAQKILNIFKVQNQFPDVSEIIIEALNDYIDNLDEYLQISSENQHND
jgi:hypothetical protein